MTPALISLQWNSMSLYPAGYFTRRIPVQATVRYPEGWSAASALPAKAEGSTYTYDKTSYEVLVDSPVLAGRYYKPFELSPRVTLDVFADTPDELKAKPEQIAAHAAVVDQEVKLMGAQHYDHYHFLVSISDELGGNGLEHHRSTEIGVPTGYFTKWDESAANRNVIPHEYTHSWDGKFRRGADLWTPDFRTPMRDSLLWVYEGQTQFWGYVIQARSGLVSKADTLEALAGIAASLDNRPARTWRDLIDTTNDPVITARRPKGWRAGSARRIITTRGCWCGSRSIRSCAPNRAAGNRWTISRAPSSGSTTATGARSPTRSTTSPGRSTTLSPTTGSRSSTGGSPSWANTPR